MNPRLDRTAFFFLSLACSIVLAPTAFAQGTEQAARRDSFITTSDGIKIHCLEAGKGAAILFVPGWTMPAWIWERQIAHFSKSFRVLAMDPRAQGESTQASEGLYPAAWARDIKALVDKLKLAPVVLVGWSMGVTEICAYVGSLARMALRILSWWTVSPALISRRRGSRA